MTIGQQPGPVWAEWKRVTRFLNSARIALAREHKLWTALEVSNQEDIELAVPSGVRNYKVSLGHHLDAVADLQTLHGAILIESYALTEAAAARTLGLDTHTNLGGIESWGKDLLVANARGWEDLKLGGKSEIVEVAVVRNAFAHGTRAIDESSSRRLIDAGSPPRAVGSVVTLDYEELCVFRDRLRGLLRVAGVDQPVPSE